MSDDNVAPFPQPPPSTLPAKPANSGQFKAGGRKGGRPKGSISRTTTVLKEAIILAAELEGWDGNGLDGLTGYLRKAARDEMRAFLPLLARVLPYTIEAKRETAPEVVYRSVTEIRQDLLRRGIDVKVITRIMDPNNHAPIEHDDEPEEAEEAEEAEQIEQPDEPGPDDAA